ncbi:YitT family protein [Sinanaerobacter sp. ZZT-01]|uniref:YitT family protein n=1 Tax=Sinanaerobacter sp. ZZT-01 TaxID=3111540 RepID=UPI002D78BD45|nr:YitT family protein [Sinanaerobacter sp. ZZT-01]WRR92563.1 YitT family protein [Sinanaerobacter sp. ZZT-01]
MKLRAKFLNFKWNKLILDIIFLCFGCAFGAFASIGVMIPNGLSSGGITGVVRILQQYINIDFSLLYYIGAMVILIICWILLGRKEAEKIILMTVLYPAFLVLFERLDFVLLEQKDMTLASIFFGIIAGIGSGLVFVRGYSSGGTDTVAKIIKIKIFPHIAMSQILLCLDSAVIICSGFVYGKNVALYALVSSVIFSKTTEMLLYGFDPKVVQLEIISDKNQVIIDYILNEIRRGVTTVMIKGEYSKVTKHKLITICSPRESMLIKRFVAETDRNAFVTVLHVETVWGAGKGFSNIAETK